MPRYAIKATLHYVYPDEHGTPTMTADTHRFWADGHIHARRIYDALRGGAANVYLYDRDRLVDSDVVGRTIHKEN